MTKRLSGKEQTHTGYTAQHERKLRRHAKATGGFDPNENPVIIGANATAGTGTPDSPSSGPTDAVAIGELATVSDVGAVAIGRATTGASYDVAIGYSTSASGGGSTALGNAATASGSIATATGGSSLASGFLSSAYGGSATATHGGDTAIGAGATTDRANQIMLGGGEVVDIAGNGNGLAVRAPNGTRYLLTVSNAAALVITATP